MPLSLLLKNCKGLHEFPGRNNISAYVSSFFFILFYVLPRIVVVMPALEYSIYAISAPAILKSRTKRTVKKVGGRPTLYSSKCWKSTLRKCHGIFKCEAEHIIYLHVIHFPYLLKEERLNQYCQKLIFGYRYYTYSELDD